MKRDDLSDHRRQIDVIDLKILELLNERSRVVEKIGNIKQELGLPIYEPKREDDVFHNVITNNPGPLPPDAVKRLFERIIDEMRTLQRMKRAAAEPASADGSK